MVCVDVVRHQRLPSTTVLPTVSGRPAFMAQASAVAAPSWSTAEDAVVLILENPAQRQHKRPGKKNLPKPAYDILKEYFFNVNRYPKKHERLELAARVNRVPGCPPDAYTANNVQGYFATLRTRHPQASTVVVKRELVEEPLSFTFASEPTTNGATIPDSTSSISAAPRKKRKLKATAVAESQATTLASTTSQHPLPSASMDGSISNLFLPAYTPSAASAPSAPPSQKKWTRLKAEGYKILTDFFKNVSRYPTAAQKAELLAAVTSIKGCEGYTIKKMTAYFSRMRIERKEPVAFVKAESPDSHLNAVLPEDTPADGWTSWVALPASSFLHDSSSGPSLVHPPFPEPEPAPLPVTDPLPILQLAPSMPQAQPKPVVQLHSQLQPPAPTPPEAQPPPFCLPQPQTEPTPTLSDPPTTAADGAAEHDPLRNPPDSPSIQPSDAVQSSSSLCSDMLQTNVPAPLELVRPAERGDAVEDSSDPIPTPTPSPKFGSKSTTQPESQSPKRGLTAAALKLLDDHYANVSPSPSTVQSAALAAQVNALSEGVRCTAKQVRKYFKKRRVEDKCEAIKAERMGAGAEEPPLMLAAVVEPGSGSRSDPSLHGVSNADLAASDLAEASPSGLAAPHGGDEVGSASEVVEPASGESLPDMSNADVGTRDLEEPTASSAALARGGGDKQDNDQTVPDIAMDDVPEHSESGDTVPGSPDPDQDREYSDVYAQIPAEEEWTAAKIEAEVEDAECDSELVAGVEPNSNSKLDESLCERDLAEDSATSSVPAPSGRDMDSIDEPVQDTSMDDVPENHELDDDVLGSPEPEHDGQCSGSHAHIHGKEDRRDAQLEADIEHARRNSEAVPEVEPESDSKLEAPESTCEMVEDALTDPAEASDSTLVALEAEDEDSNDRALPEVCSMDDVHESPKPEEATDLGSDRSAPENDTPMDVDPDPVPSAIIQVDVLGLAAQLQRVFSRPPALDEGHPTTFADFATWLEARNVSLVCASS
ncbi:hypothetical protein V8D89_014946 [Ganoderma adspersum]